VTAENKGHEECAEAIRRAVALWRDHGNLLGLVLGAEGIPSKWLDDLELRTEIETAGRDLHTRFDESDDWSNRYPGW